MVNPENPEKQAIASLHIMSSDRGDEEILLYEKDQHGVLEYGSSWIDDGKQAQSKLIDLKPGTMARLKSKLDFETPQALEPHIMGCDGVFYDLIIYKSEQEQKYSWWVYAPKGWESVVDAANALLSAVGLNTRVEINL